jgi:hypothetical protein
VFDSITGRGIVDEKAGGAFSPDGSEWRTRFTSSDDAVLQYDARSQGPLVRQLTDTGGGLLTFGSEAKILASARMRKSRCGAANREIAESYGVKTMPPETLAFKSTSRHAGVPGRTRRLSAGPK